MKTEDQSGQGFDGAKFTARFGCGFFAGLVIALPFLEGITDELGLDSATTLAAVLGLGCLIGYLFWKFGEPFWSRFFVLWRWFWRFFGPPY